VGVVYLLDTHVFLWWLFNDPQLGLECREIICNPEHQILVSSASAWEIATKYRLGKLPEAEELIGNYEGILERANFIELPISTAHALRAGRLPIEHRDPFDRMLMAQAELEGMPILTYDKAFNTGLIHVISGFS
jgi:PIN domain nuclease of toxin-antitoxin system